MKELLNKAVSRIKMSFCKALIKAVTDTDEIQLVKISGLAGETQDKIERLQSYGLTSSPPLDSEALVVYLNGARDDGVVIVTDSGAYRIKSLKTGEVCLYSQHGQKILLNENGEVEVTGATDIILNGSTDSAVAFTDLKTGFDLLKTQVNAFITAYNSHIGHTAVGPEPPDVLGVPITATIDAAEVPTVKVP